MKWPLKLKSILYVGPANSFLIFDKIQYLGPQLLTWINVNPSMDK